MREGAVAKEAPPTPRGGIVLTFLSGAMGLLLLLATAFLALSRQASRSLALAVAGGRATLSASSGLEYAFARLGDAPLPSSDGSPARRGDDWTFRDGGSVLGERTANPSYSHGEPWIDADGDGVRGAGEGTQADLDGDLDFSAWSGRLRGGISPFSLRFALRIDAPDGRIPFTSRNAVNNLGAIVLDPVTCLRRWDVPAGPDLDGDGLGDGEPLRASWLADDLVSGRPYRDWGAVERHLLGLPAPYQQAEIDALRPLLDIGPPQEPLGASARTLNRVNLRVAPKEVLQAVWMYIATQSPCAGSPRPSPNDFPGEAAGCSRTCPHSRLLFGDLTPPAGVDMVQMILWPGEARALAEWTAAWRRKGDVSWQSFRRGLAESADTLFAADFAALSGLPGFQWSWAQAKAHLAYQAVATDPYPWPTALDPYPWSGKTQELAAWSTGGVLDGNPALPGPQIPPTIGFDRIFRPRYPFEIAKGAVPDWRRNQLVPPLLAPETPYRVIDRMSKPDLVLTLTPPSRFEAESLGLAGGGAKARIGARMKAGESVELSCQEDFEGLSGGAVLSKLRGIESIDAPGPAARRGAPSGHTPRIASFPQWNWRGISSSKQEFSRENGALTLATAEGGRQGAVLYWPFTEDFDGQESVASAPSWSEQWCVYDASYGWTRESSLPVKPPWRSPFLYNRSTSLLAVCVTPPLYLTCPGIVPRFWNGKLNKERIVKLSIGAVFGPMSSWKLEVPGLSGSYLAVSSGRGAKSGPESPGTFFTVEVFWRSRALPINGPVIPRSRSIWFIPDAWRPPGSALSYQVLLAMRRTGGPAPAPYKFEGRLYVDGASAAYEGEMVHVHDGMDPALNPTPTPHGDLEGHSGACGFHAVHLDDLRFYGTAVNPSVTDRFVSSGTYTSPRYRLGGPVWLSDLQWNDVVPPGRDAPVRIELLAWDAAGNPLPMPPPFGKGGETVDLRAAAGVPVGAFQYKVHLSMAGSPGPTGDAPVFESVWISFSRRRGASPWTDWWAR